MYARMPTPDARTTTRGRYAVASLFFLNGFGFGVWVAHLPLFKARLALSDGALGLALLGAALATLVAMPIVGVVMARVGSRGPCAVATLGASLVLVLPFLAPSYATFCIAAIVLGAVFSSFDVAINAQAVVVERRLGRVAMSSFHALFSFGGLIGSAAAAAAISRDLGFVATAALTSGTCLAIASFALPALVGDPPATHGAPGTRVRTSGRASFAPIVLFGVLAFLGLVGEGAMADWSGIYARTLGVAAAASAIGFGAFSIAMSLGRAVGDSIVARFGPRATIAGGAALAASALGGALAVHAVWAAYLGFACVGLGLANVVPVLFSAAGRTPGVPSSLGIALVSTLGYVGFVVGPPVIGFTSDAYGLRFALWLVVAAIGAVAVLAPFASLGARYARLEPAVASSTTSA